MKKRILAVASGGGHWMQLMRIKPAFYGNQIYYITTMAGYSTDNNDPIYTITDANEWEKLKLLKMLFQVGYLVCRIRPEVIISTGAAPGLAALFWGKLLGAKTIWIDSIANSESMSKSGRIAKYLSNLWLTQWSHLTKESGPRFWGSVI